MADAQLKRLRSEDPEASGSDDPSPISKRSNTYGSILSLLDQEEDGSQDLTKLTDVFSTLKQEISSADAFDLDSPTFAAAEERSAEDGPDEDDGAESVIRRLLEASDDELGIPSAEELLYDNNNINQNNNIIINNENVDDIRSGENLPFAFVDNLWELEDVAANYYAMLQSELFI